MDPFNTKQRKLEEAWSKMNESEKSDSFCYMLYVAPKDEKMFTDLQKELGLKGELTESGKFHITVRYVKRIDYEPFVEYLKKQELPVLKAKCREWGIFGSDKDALVIEMDGEEIHSYFKKINKWLVDNGYPESDFPDYKPHITLTYDKGIEKPEWKKEYEKEITFSIHIVTDTDYEEVFRKKV